MVNVGGVGSLDQTLAALRPGGEVAMVGSLQEGSSALDQMLLRGKAAIIRGIAVGSLEMCISMTRAIDALQLKPVIGERFGFDQLHDAYRARQSPAVFGKIVIMVQ